MSTESSPQPAALDYDPPTRPRGGRWRRLLASCFHTRALPLLLLPGAIGSTHWVGDEYGALIGANVPALLLTLYFPRMMMTVERWSINAAWVAPSVLLMIAAGALMDVLRVRRWVYLLLPAVFVGMVLSKWAMPGYVPPVKNMRGHEFDPESLCVAWCWSLYLLAGVVVLVGTAIVCIKAVFRPPLR
jgi:hypothetical protein